MKVVGNPKSSKNKTNLQYINRGNPHFMNQFFKVELDLNFT